MKKWTLLISILAVVVGCQKRNQNIAEKLKVESEEVIRLNQQKIDDVNKQQAAIDQLKVGGQPASIYLSGSLIQDNTQSPPKTVEPLKIELLGGVGKNGKRAGVELKDKISVDKSEAPAQSDVSNLGNYINIGCTNLNAADTANLKEMKLNFYTDKARGKDFLSVIAKRVFICGPVRANHPLVYFSAEEVHFMNATIHLKENLINMALRAKVVGVHGTNVVIHKAKPVSLSGRSDEAKISLIADGKLFGTGTLSIQSEGGTYTESGEPKKDDKKAEPKKEDTKKDEPKK
jgi:hypothetical protein